MTQLYDHNNEPITPSKPLARRTGRGPAALSGSYTNATRDRLRQRIGGMPPLASSRRHRDGRTLEKLTRECEHLLRNDHMTAAIVAGYISMVVGSGPRLECRSGDEEWDRDTEERFGDWASGGGIYGQLGGCDTSRTMTLTQCAASVACGWFTGGGTLVHRVNGHGLRPGSIELIEAVRLKNPAGQADDETHAAGVEFNEHGRVTRYHIAKWERFGQLGTHTDPVDPTCCRLVIDPFLPLNGGGGGGGRTEPRLGRVLDRLETCNSAVESTFTSYEIATMVSLFIATALPETASTEQMVQAMVEAGLADSTTEARELGEWASGTILRGQPGDTISQIKPEHPTTSFDQLYWTEMQGLSAGLGLAPEIAFYRFIKNFSASRSAIAINWRSIDAAQQHLVRAMLSPVFRWWLTGEQLAGRIGDPSPAEPATARRGVKRSALRHRFVMPTMPVLDPKVEIEAGLAGIAGGVMLPETVIQALGGGDFGTFVPKLKKQLRALREADIEPGQRPVFKSESSTEESAPAADAAQSGDGP